jgi:hypothetical protein
MRIRRKTGNGPNDGGRIEEIFAGKNAGFVKKFDLYNKI